MRAMNRSKTEGGDGELWGQVMGEKGYFRQGSFYRGDVE